MKSLLIACSLLWKRKLATFILILQVLLSIIALTQVYVFILNHYDNIRAISELPVDNVLVLHAFDYYTPEEIAENIWCSDRSIDIGMVQLGSAYCEGIECKMAVYNSAIADHYQPALSNGAWFNHPETDPNAIPVIISGDIPAEPGDMVHITLASERSFAACVTGVLKLPSQYLYPSGSASPEYFSASSIIGNGPVLLFMEEDYPRFTADVENDDSSLSDNLFLFVKDNYINSVNAELRKTWNQYGEITSMEDLVSNYTHNTHVLIDGGLITFLIFFALAVTSVLGNSYIQALKNSNAYTIYYMLGMSWKSIALAEAYRSLIILACMCFISYLAGRYGLLMTEWLSPERILSLYGVIFLYLAIIFSLVSLVFLHRLLHKDISVILKELHRGE